MHEVLRELVWPGGLGPEMNNWAAAYSTELEMPEKEGSTGTGQSLAQGKEPPSI